MREESSAAVLRLPFRPCRGQAAADRCRNHLALVEAGRIFLRKIGTARARKGRGENEEEEEEEEEARTTLEREKYSPRCTSLPKQYLRHRPLQRWG